ncbi:hypothetical protein ACVI1T_000417 [Rhizobium redzepovicii]
MTTVKKMGHAPDRKRGPKGLVPFVVAASCRRLTLTGLNDGDASERKGVAWRNCGERPGKVVYLLVGF